MSRNKDANLEIYNFFGTGRYRKKAESILDQHGVGKANLTGNKDTNLEIVDVPFI